MPIARNRHTCFWFGRGEWSRRSRAAAAINGVLARLPGKRNAFFRIFAALYRVPGLRQLEELGYRIIARNRHRLGAASCAPDSRDQR